MKLQTRLRKLRTKHQLTQDDAAKKLNVSRKTISSWENGRSIPDDESLAMLTKLYDYPLIDNDTVSNNSAKRNQSPAPTNLDQEHPHVSKYWLIFLLTCNAIVFIMAMMNFLNNDFARIGFLELIVDAFSLVYLNHYLIQIIKKNPVIILIGIIWFLLFVYFFVLKSYIDGHSRWPLWLVILKSMFVTSFFTYVFIILITSHHLYQKIINHQ